MAAGGIAVKSERESSGWRFQWIVDAKTSSEDFSSGASVMVISNNTGGEIEVGAWYIIYCPFMILPCAANRPDSSREEIASAIKWWRDLAAGGQHCGDIQYSVPWAVLTTGEFSE
jgi:hypothetical protein